MQTPEQRVASNQKYYLANRDKVQALNKRNKQRNFAYVRQLKEASPCVDCGTSYPYYVMDFDHIGEDKERDISRLAGRGVSIATLDKEIAKCELVCANCHRVRTYKRQASIA